MGPWIYSNDYDQIFTKNSNFGIKWYKVDMLNTK